MKTAEVTKARSDSLDAPKPPEIGIASIIRPVPLLLESPNDAILRELPLNANKHRVRADTIMAILRGELRLVGYSRLR